MLNNVIICPVRDTILVERENNPPSHRPVGTEYGNKA